jgi:hypothetical protein
MKKNNLIAKFLEGTWKNEFIDNGKADSEICDIKADGSYHINGEHWFNITDVTYDAGTNQLSFIKAAARPGDDRKFYNTVTVTDSDYLINCNDNSQAGRGYSVSYKRLKLV